MSTRIIFNGKEYSGVEEMPPDVRRAYQKLSGLLEDRDRDGVPDIVQLVGSSNQLTVSQTCIVFDGKVYNSVEELPLEARRKYEKAMGKLGDADRHGIPDVFRGDRAESIEQVRKTVVLEGPTLKVEGLGSLAGAGKSLLLSFGVALLAVLVVGILALAFIAVKLG